jgi:anti-sigma28 factor (negative regulator of flagellin synthesis)
MRKAERIKAEIAAGKYSVSSSDVAESLVSEPSDPHETSTSDNKSS